MTQIKSVQLLRIPGRRTTGSAPTEPNIMRRAISHGVAAAAHVNRAILRHWPDWAAKILVFRLVNRAINWLNVELACDTKWGGRFLCNIRDLIQSRIFYSGVWEPSLTAYIQSRLRPGDIFVDVGANIGYFTVLGARLVGPAGRVIAIEASPSIYQKLNRSLALNGATNVDALNVAVAPTRGKVDIFLGPAWNLGATSLRGEDGGRSEATIEAAPLSEILAHVDLSRVRLFKIDVEGSEASLLRDLLGLLPRLNPNVEIIVEIAPSRVAEGDTVVRNLFADFRAAGFRWLFLDNDYSWTGYYRVDMYPPVPSDEVPTEQVDVIFRRGEEAASTRP